MKKITLLLFSILLGCSMGSRAITMDDFYEVELGMTKQELTEKLGKPYLIQRIGDRVERYEYIEKISSADRVMEERHYFFSIKEGRVFSKEVKTFSITPFERNSYDMQTSENF